MGKQQRAHRPAQFFKREFWGTKERLELLRRLYASDAKPAEIIVELAKIPGPALPRWTTIAEYAVRNLGVRRTNRSRLFGRHKTDYVAAVKVEHKPRTAWQNKMHVSGDDQYKTERAIRAASDRFAKAVNAPLWTPTT